MGRSFSHDFLKIELGKLWQTKGTMNLICLGKGFYSYKCSSGEEKSKILVGGPWFLMGHLVWVQPWCPGFQPSTSQIKQFPVWIQLPELPMEFFRRELLQKIGDGVGKTLKVDSHSVDGGRRRYAAVCTLVQEHKRLPKRIYIGGHVQPLTYVEGPWWCTSCNQVGHGSKNCQDNPAQLTVDVSNSGEAISGMKAVRKETNEGVDWVPARRRRESRKNDGRGIVVAGPSVRWTPKKLEGDTRDTSKAVALKVTKTPVQSSIVISGDILETPNPFLILQGEKSEDAEEIATQITYPTVILKRTPPL